MSQSKVIRNENNIHLGTLAPDDMAAQVSWESIMNAQEGNIYMRPLLTLTFHGNLHWVGIVVLRGQLILLETFKDSGISLHTLISMAMHTVGDGMAKTMKGVRIQLHSQGQTCQCWSRLFVYMGALACHIKADSEFEHVLQILSVTQVIVMHFVLCIGALCLLCRRRSCSYRCSKRWYHLVLIS